MLIFLENMNYFFYKNMNFDLKSKDLNFHKKNMNLDYKFDPNIWI